MHVSEINTLFSRTPWHSSCSPIRAVVQRHKLITLKKVSVLTNRLIKSLILCFGIFLFGCSNSAQKLETNLEESSSISSQEFEEISDVALPKSDTETTSATHSSAITTPTAVANSAVNNTDFSHFSLQDIVMPPTLHEGTRFDLTNEAPLTERPAQKKQGYKPHKPLKKNSKNIPKNDKPVTATATLTTAATTTWDFTTDTSTSVTLKDCEIIDGALQLGKNADGSMISECYADITADNLAGKMIQLESEYTNAITDGDFNTSPQIKLYNPKTTANAVARATGAWYSSASWPSLVPQLATDSTGNITINVSKSGSLEHYFKIMPGTDYRLTFDIAPSHLTINETATQATYYSVQFFDKNFNLLNFTNPINDATVNSLGVLNMLSAESDSGFNRIRIRTIDCDDHAKSLAKDGISTTDVYYNHCKDSAGNPQTNSLGAPYTATDIAYASAIFSVNWDGIGIATLDNIGINDLEQIKIRLMNDDETVATESHSDSALLVDDLSTAKKFRIVLRSTVDNQSPKIKIIKLANPSVEISVGAQQSAFTEARLGATTGLPTAQDWYDRNDVRSLCIDPFDDTQLPCFVLMVKYGITRIRNYIPNDYLNFILNEDPDISHDNYQFSFHTGSYENKQEPDSILHHFKSIVDSGMHILMIADYGAYGTYFDKHYDGWFDTAGLLNDALDPTPDNDSDDPAQIIDLIQETARFMVNSFNGQTDYTDSHGETFILPLINDWQIGVEHNLGGEAPWFLALNADEQADVLEKTASAIREADPNATTQTSLSANNTQYTSHTFDDEYIESTLSKIDPETYTHFNFNTLHGEGLQPEDWIDGLAELKAQNYFSGWKNKILTVGAYDVSIHSYNPNCDKEWIRGFGERYQAQKIATEVLTLLYMPIEAMYDFVIFDNEGWAGGNLNFDECRINSGSQLFNRVSGTGNLDGKDEASIYQVNPAGLTYFIIGKYLSKSNGLETKVISQENIHAAAYKTFDGKTYLAVWQVISDIYATTYMNYETGLYDNGLNSDRKIDVNLSGLTTTTAMQISLTDGAQSELAVSGSQIQGIELKGDMPTLIEIK